MTVDFFRVKRSRFEQKKHHSLELKIYFLNLKKSATEAEQLLVKAYGETALSERSRREQVRKFENANDDERRGKPQVFEFALWEEHS